MNVVTKVINNLILGILKYVVTSDIVYRIYLVISNDETRYYIKTFCNGELFH